MYRSIQPFDGLHILLLCAFLVCVNASVNFTGCLIDFQSGIYGTEGGVDYQGHPVNYLNASGITYDMCLRICGPSQEPFNWSGFSQQFSSWLLPWVALVSQLPFYGGTRLTNLDSGKYGFDASACGIHIISVFIW
jgi:hypothetical protein